MATNKVVYGNTTLIDLTSDTATEADVMSGKTFHKANGEQATGTASTGKPEQSKTITATTLQQTVSPDSGYALSSVVVNPQSHASSPKYTPAQNTASNDMGEHHNYRYVNTSGMIVPNGSQTLSANGSYDISTKASVSVNVPVVRSYFDMTSSDISVNVGFKPKQLFVYNYQTSGNQYTHIISIYDELLSNSVIMVAWRTSSSTGCQRYAMNSGTGGGIQSITSTGFTFKKSNTGMSRYYYVAYG